MLLCGGAKQVMTLAMPGNVVRIGVWHNVALWVGISTGGGSVCVIKRWVGGLRLS